MFIIDGGKWTAWARRGRQLRLLFLSVVQTAAIQAARNDSALFGEFLKARCARPGARG